MNTKNNQTQTNTQIQQQLSCSNWTHENWLVILQKITWCRKDAPFWDGSPQFLIVEKSTTSIKNGRKYKLTWEYSFFFSGFDIFLFWCRCGQSQFLSQPLLAFRFMFLLAFSIQGDPPSLSSPFPYPMWKNKMYPGKPFLPNFFRHYKSINTSHILTLQPPPFPFFETFSPIFSIFPFIGINLVGTHFSLHRSGLFIEES